uniref:Uncharacterized protein n=1 Tax=Opuntia streptacantha TaxID=393608 RepID=A0A7C9A9R7_OPUST
MIASNSVQLLLVLLSLSIHVKCKQHLVGMGEEASYLFRDVIPTTSTQLALLLGNRVELIEQIVDIIKSILELVYPVLVSMGELLLLGICIKKHSFDGSDSVFELLKLRFVPKNGTNLVEDGGVKGSKECLSNCECHSGSHVCGVQLELFEIFD